MTIKEAIRLLDPATSAQAIAEIEYYGGFSGRIAAVQAISDACVIACRVMRKEQGEELPLVRRGRWFTAESHNGYLYWNCDQCKKHFTSQKSNYCPNCGAKMDGGVNDE